MTTQRITDFNNLDDLDHRHADALNEHMWTRPDSYGGHSPDGDIVLAVQHRDSDTLERSNFDSILDIFKNKGIYVEDGWNVDDPDPDRPYAFRAGHWAVGWIEYIIVPQTANLEILTLAGEILCSLSDYPVVNDEHYSALQYDEATTIW